MTRSDHTTSQSKPVSLTTRMLVGSGIGLFLISLLLLSVDEAKPEWGKFWMIRPLIMVPLAGAMGGLCNHFITRFCSSAGLSKAIAVILSLVVFVVGVWLGTVLGLDGTLWN